MVPDAAAMANIGTKLYTMQINRVTGNIDASEAAALEILIPGWESVPLSAQQRAELHLSKIIGTLTPEQVATTERNLPGWAWKDAGDHTKALVDWVQLDPATRLGTVPDRSVMHDGLAIGLFAMGSTARDDHPRRP